MRVIQYCLKPKKHQMELRQRNKPQEKQPLLIQSSVTAKAQPSSKLGLFTLVGISIVLTQVVCEVTKQTSNYSLQYFNGGHYPIPQTVIVVICELVKLVATIFRSKGCVPNFFNLQSLKGSLRFLLPSVLYAINNNIYYAGLTLVPPPIWLILCSIRTVVTATIYKFVLRRQLTSLQFLGALMIVISIGIAKTPDILQIIYPVSDQTVLGGINKNATSDLPTNAVNVIPITAILLALVASCNSVGAAVYTEQLFKSGSNKNGETFLDQQFWLYSYGALVATIVHFISKPTYTFTSLIEDLEVVNGKVMTFLVVAILFSSLGGIAVASILKYLDNIVKEYTGSVANIITAIVSSVLFPDKFMFTPYVILSMCSLLSGIYLYETKKAKENEPQK